MTAALRRALTVLLAVATVGLAAGGCGSAGRAAARRSPRTQQAPVSAPGTPSAAPTDLTAWLLHPGDMPAGFVPRPLTSRNLPSQLTGCPPLERLADATGPHEQEEFYLPPLGPWIDEAAAWPGGGRGGRVPGAVATGTAATGTAATGTAAAGLTAAFARAIESCGTITMTEEGHSVTLRLSKAAPVPLPVATATAAEHAYVATGALRGIVYSMRIVLVPAGGVALVIAETDLGSPGDFRIGAQVVQAAVARAGSAGAGGTGGA